MSARVKVKPEGPAIQAPSGLSSCLEGYSATCTSCGVLSLDGGLPHRTFFLDSALIQARAHLRRMHP